MDYKQKKIKEFRNKYGYIDHNTDERRLDGVQIDAVEAEQFLSDIIDELQSKQLEPISEKELYPIIHSLRTEQDYIPSKDIVEMICSKLGQPKCECEVDYEQMIGLMSETHSGNINEAMEIIKSFKDNESKWLTIKER